MVVFDNDKFFFAAVIFLFVREKIRRESFLLHEVAAILFVADHAQNDGVAPLFDAHRRDACFAKLARDDVCAFVFICKLMEDKSHDFGAVFIYRHFAVFNIVAQHASAEHNALFHAAFLPPFYTFGRLTAFFLRNRGHDRQAELCISV